MTSKKAQLSDEAFFNLIAEAQLSPSVHNVQPAKVKRVTSTEYVLFGDLTCWLQVSDPEKNDHFKSLGSFIEGLSLAALKIGLKLHYGALSFETPSELHQVTEFWFESSIESDDLSDFLALRKSWRGNFQDETGLKIELHEEFKDKVLMITESNTKSQISNLFDRSNSYFYHDKSFLKELLQWLRPTKAHPRYMIDGLNRECLQLNLIEGLSLPILFRPSVTPLLYSLGLGEVLFSEKSKTESAAAIVFVKAKTSQSAFENGRLFHRVWLEFTRQDLYGCPLSALLDEPTVSKEMRSLLNLQDSEALVGVWRFGRVANKTLFQSRARKPLSEILIE